METEQLSRGMRVNSLDGLAIGTIKDLINDGLHVHIDCKFSPDMYVPLDAVQRVDEDHAVLAYTRHEAGNMGWEIAPEVPPPE